MIDPHATPHGRSPDTVDIARHFSFDHLPYGVVRDTSGMCYALAEVMVDWLPDGAELTTGLRKLLEAKDCFVRAAGDIEHPKPEANE